MREIKFRAWDKTSNLMLDLLVFKDEEGCVLMQATEQPKTVYRNNPENVEIMQFTGLKDKNGKEVYEGDIIQTFKTEYPSRKLIPHDVRTVVWGKIGFEFRKDGENGYVNLYDPEFLQVIGNTFEQQ